MMQYDASKSQLSSLYNIEFDKQNAESEQPCKIGKGGMYIVYCIWPSVGMARNFILCTMWCCRQYTIKLFENFLV